MPQKERNKTGTCSWEMYARTVFEGESLDLARGLQETKMEMIADMETNHRVEHVTKALIWRGDVRREQQKGVWDSGVDSCRLGRRAKVGVRAGYNSVIELGCNQERKWTSNLGEMLRTKPRYHQREERKTVHPYADENRILGLKSMLWDTLEPIMGKGVIESVQCHSNVETETI
ncbi:hypothetical protein Tco_0431064 [Tanacetum coccineum]